MSSFYDASDALDAYEDPMAMGQDFLPKKVHHALTIAEDIETVGELLLELF